MAKPKRKFADDKKVRGGVLKRAKRRAKKLGRLDEVRKGGITGAEARNVAGAYKRKRGGNKPATSNKGGTAGGIRGRAEERLGYLEEHGGLQGLEGIRKGGISRPEARKVRKAWQQEKRFNPLEPRSGRGILNEANALTQLQYAPQEAEIGRQQQYEQGRQNVLYGPGGWFQQYQQDVAGAAQRQQVAEQAFQAGANAYAFNASAQAQGQLGQQAQSAPGQVAGGQVSPDVQAQAQQAADARMSMAQQAAVGLAARGASNVGAVNQLAISAGQQAQEGLMNSQARMQKVSDLARELSVEKGQYRTKAIGELKDTERTYDLNTKAFGLDVAEEENRAGEAKAKLSQDRRELKALVGQRRFDNLMTNKKFKLDMRKFGADEAYRRWQRQHGNRQDDISQQNADTSRMRANLSRDQADINSDGKVNAKDVKLRDRITGGSTGSGLSESERDKVGGATSVLRELDRSGQLKGKRKQVVIDRIAQKENLPPRLVKRAVERYWKKHKLGGSAGGAIGQRGREGGGVNF